MAKCETIISLMENIAPRHLAEDWDNVGLLIGDSNKPINRIFVCLDLPEWVLEEALDRDVDLIITHHPIIFSGLKKISSDTAIGRKVMKLIKNNICVYSSHTNLDITKDGLNDALANKLGFKSYDIIQPTGIEDLYKVVVYIPEGDERRLLNSLSKAGAGYIGNYSSCSFRSKGLGTFKAEEDATPYIGHKGILEEVIEYKVETVVPENLLKGVIKEIINNHPYEEPAYDIFKLNNKGEIRGIGRLGELNKSVSLLSYVEFVRSALEIKNIAYAGKPDRLIKKVAIINGSGNKYVGVAKRSGADVLITGDMQYHQIVDALEDGLSIIDAGHFDTEKQMIKMVTNYLKSVIGKLGYTVEVIDSKTNINPIKILGE